MMKSCVSLFRLSENQNNNLLNKRSYCKDNFRTLGRGLEMVSRVFLLHLPENWTKNLLNQRFYEIHNVETITKELPYRFIYFTYIDIRCRKKKRGKERERTGRIVPDDFTTMINRHRLLIVLDLDGGTAGATGSCISDSTKGPRAFDSLGSERCSTYRL